MSENDTKGLIMSEEQVRCPECDTPIGLIPHRESCEWHAQNMARIQDLWPEEIVEPDDPPGPWRRLRNWWARMHGSWNGDPRDLL